MKLLRILAWVAATLIVTVEGWRVVAGLAHSLNGATDFYSPSPVMATMLLLAMAVTFFVFPAKAKQ